MNKIFKFKFIKLGKYKIGIKYAFLILAMLVFANYGIYIAIKHYFFAQLCYTKDQVASDAKCLYILNNKVYEKGTKNAPHQGHPCGMDVTSIIPSFHLANVAAYLDPNYKGIICTTVNSPTPDPTEVPTEMPIPTETPYPSETPYPTDTPYPTETPYPSNTPVPSMTPIKVPTGTISPKPSITIYCPVPQKVNNIKVSCPLCK